ncbi:MAG: LacI family DNA-binding transcriptional regulator, partial [Chthoniobacterales bacterium]
MTTPTLKQIAEHAGVSVSTSSMAVRDHHAISIETKRRVWEVQERLGYRPDLRPKQARRRGGSTGTKISSIAFLLVDREFDDPAYSRSFQGVANRIALRDWRSTYVSTSLADIHQKNFPSPLRNREVQGIIVSGDYDELAHRNLCNLEIPLVTMGNYQLGEIPWAACEIDLAQGMRTVVRRLSALGHMRFGLLLRSAVTEYQLKLQHWFKREVALEKRENAGVAIEVSEGSVRNSLIGYLRSPTRPSVLIFESDTLAEEVYDTCAELKLNIPNDISLITVGDGRHILRPALASIQ